MTGNDLYSLPIAFLPARRVTYCKRGIFEAADYLIPVIRDDKYHAALIAIRESNNS
jgi:hypothetical protein